MDLNTLYSDISELLPVSSEPSDHQPPTPSAISPKTTNFWDPRLILDLAIGIDSTEDILSRYGLSRKEFDSLLNSPSFKRELSATIKETRERGVTFTAKARVQAESYLEILDDLIYDVSVPHGVRLDAIKSTVKWAGLEPDNAKEDKSVGTSVNIQINF